MGSQRDAGDDERSAAVGAQLSRGGGGNIEPLREQTAKASAPIPPPSPAQPCRASSLRLLHHMEAAESANQAKSNKSVPPQQHTGLPAAQGSLRQDTDGMGEGSACIPGNAWAEKPITHIRKGHGEASRSTGKSRAPHQQTLLGSLLWLHIQMPWNSQNVLETHPGLS